MVNSAKTKMVLFPRKRKLLIDPPTLFGVKLGISNRVKYLSVLPNGRLSWRHHIEGVVKKGMATFWICRRMFGSTWGLNPRVV